MMESKYLAYLENGMCVGPVVKADKLPNAPLMGGFKLDELPRDRDGYRPNYGIFDSMAFGTFPMQWDKHGNQINGHRGMRVFRLVKLGAGHEVTPQLRIEE